MTTPMVEAALSRAAQPWTPSLSNTEVEQAYLDRTVLANTVQTLRVTIQGYLDRADTLELAIADLRRDSEKLARQVRNAEHTLALAHWVEVEPGEFINPAVIQHVRDIGPGGEGQPRCQVLMAMSGVTVNHTAAEVVSMLGDLP